MALSYLCSWMSIPEICIRRRGRKENRCAGCSVNGTSRSISAGPLPDVGFQGHDKMDWPTVAQADAAIAAVAALGIKVNITELNIDVLLRVNRSHTAEGSMTTKMQANLNPYPDGLPDSVQEAPAKRYAELFQVFLTPREVIDQVTFGVADGDSVE